MNMKHPVPGDFIDMHTHRARAAKGVFSVESLMAHENLQPEIVEGIGFTAGIHPWNLTADNREQQIDYIRSVAENENVLAIGEAGFDRLKGPSAELQRITFEEQVMISKEVRKPVVIHCVKAWDELFSAHRKLKPSLPWLIHGFRGKYELATQLLKHGMYLSFWFKFILRPESAKLLRLLPAGRIFLETDGSGVPVEEIYEKASADLGLPVEDLKTIILSNFRQFFNLGNQEAEGS